jgi:fructokinase
MIPKASPAARPAPSEILCVGEVLWDSLPSGLFLGGAPFNVACHLRAAGVPAAMVSRIGDDRLGTEIVARATRFGVTVDLIQVDEQLPTGFVCVTLDEGGVPAYDIVAPAAWDAISISDALLKRAAAARAVVFGSLAQRQPVTRATIEKLWESDALMVFDVNLRPPFDDREVVRRSLKRAGMVKMSEQELLQLTSWFGLPSGIRAGGTAIAEQFGCDTVCVTRGDQGAALLHEGSWTEQAGFEVEVRDTVGAGDAFLAVLLVGLLNGLAPSAALEHANLIGAYVVTQYGAVPTDQDAAAPLPLAAVRPQRKRTRN